MKVTIKPLKGETFEVEYEPDTLVKDLKESIAKVKPEMPAEGQKLIYSGKILNNDSPMKDYGIKEGEFLVVMVAKAKAPAPAPAPAPAATPTPAPAADPAADPAALAPDAQQMAASAMPTNTAGMDAAIEQLMAMGFERPQVESCLRAAFGNPDRAVEYLMSGIPEGISQEMAGGGAVPGAGGAPPAAPTAGAGVGGASPFPAMPTGGGGAFPAMPTGGGGGGANEPLPPALEALRESPQFAQLAQMVAQNPSSLQRMLPALAASNPEAAQAVSQHPEAFMRMLMEAAGGGGGGGAPGMPQMPAGGGGMPGGPNAQMAQALAANPAMLQQVADEIAQSDPELAEQIRTNPQAFAQLMQAMAAGGAGGMPGMPGGGGMPGAGGGMPPGAGGGGQHVVRLTEEEGQAVARLCELGFDRQIAAQAYLACDKNEELAANYLFEHGADGD